MRPSGRRRFRLALAAAALGAVVHGAAAQIPGERRGTQMLFLGVQARAVALGDAVAALPGEASGPRVNPALAALLTGAGVELGSAAIGRRAGAEDFTAGIPLGGRAGVSLHAAILHSGQLSFLSDPAVRARGFELRTGLSAGLRFTRHLAGGVLVDVLHATTGVDPVWGVAGGAGLAYTPGRYTSFGAALRGIGSDVDVHPSVLTSDVPDRVIPRVFSLSAAGDFPLGGAHRLLLLYQSDRVVGRPGVIFRFGSEYQPLRAVALRAGIAVRQGSTEPRAGLGVTLGGLSAGYAYRYSRRDGVSHAVTLGYRSP